jgi:hypothetical protein
MGENGVAFVRKRRLGEEEALMSTRDDARLTAQERAALASLEAAAAADDPQFASRLKGSGRARVESLLRGPAAYVAAGWAALVSRSWVGVPLVVVGLSLVAIGMSSGLAVGIAGSLCAAGGLGLLASALERAARQRSATREASSDSASD